MRVQLADDHGARRPQPRDRLASAAGTRCSTFDAAVVGMPATSITSLTAIRPAVARLGIEVEKRVERVERHGVASAGRRSSSSRARAGSREEAEHALEILVLGIDPLRGGKRAQVIDDGTGLDSEPMPIYEYRCEKCEERYEEYLSTSDKPAPACPTCGSQKVERLISKINTEWLPSDVEWGRVGQKWD